jgi:hypothetical protein
MVENISYFMCPHCGGRCEIFSHEWRPLGSRTARHRVSRGRCSSIRRSAKPPTAAPRSPSLSPTTRTRWFSAVWGRIWDKSPGKAVIAARVVIGIDEFASYGLNTEFLASLSNYKIATFASYPFTASEIRQRFGSPREDAGACKFLAETGERCGRGAFSRMPFCAAGCGPVSSSARAIPAPKGRSISGPPARLRSSGG